MEIKQSDKELKKIIDTISSAHSDFLTYCAESGKAYVSDVTSMDYVAFRTMYGKSKEYIRELRLEMENGTCKSNADEGNAHDIKENVNNSLSLDEMNTVKCDNSVTLSTEHRIQTDERTLSKRFHVIASDFSTVGINELNLSGRPTNCLKRIKCKTLADILLMSEDELQNIRNMGSKSKEEIVQAVKKYISNISTSEETIAKRFHVIPSDFSTLSIDELNLSVRPTNCLHSVKCKTIMDILLMSEDDLQNIRNMGSKSKKEIIQAIEKYISNHKGSTDTGMTRERLNSKRIKLTSYLKKAVEGLLRDESYDLECLSANQISAFMSVKEAVNTIGVELCKAAYDNPDYNVKVCNMLWDYSRKISSYEEIEKKIKLLPAHIRNLSILPFIEIYERKTNEGLSWLISQCSPETQIQGLLEIFNLKADNENSLLKLDELGTFLDWMNFDIIEIASLIWQNFLDSIKSERTRSIFFMRAEGKTLEEIGKAYNVSRERIRQIEKKTFKSFWWQYHHQDYDVVMLTYAILEGKDTISFKDLQEIIGDFSIILWNCLKHDPKHGNYYYSKMMDMIIIRHEHVRNINDNSLLRLKQKFQEEIPSFFEISQKEEILSKFIQKNSPSSVASKALVERLFENSYKKSGSFYYKGRITVTYMCEYILKNRFQSGFKIADDYEADRFREYMKEIFGNTSTITNRALDAVISKVGILCDRGKYIHPDFIQIEHRIIDAINRYIERSDRVVFPYGEIYEELQDLLLGTQITNRYLLQGALKKYGCAYRTDRDNIKKNESATFVDELDAFVEEYGVVHKSQIFDEFKSLGEAGLGQVVARSSNVFNIDQGYYIHVSQFDIHPEDYESIRKYLQEACRDVPITIAAIYNDGISRFPDFISRNDFDDSNRLFAALQYMFQTEFKFSRPYIGKLDEESITSKSVLLQYLEEYDSIEIEELVDICDENSIHYTSINYLVQNLMPEYIRVGISTVMKKELTGISDDVVDSTVETIQEMIDTNEYIASAKINDFLWFPQIDIDWNEFLLENIIALSHKIQIIYRSGNQSGHANAIYVSDEYKNDNFESFLIKLLNREVQKGSFTSKNDMTEWLKEEGLIVKKLPIFLESDKYFYVDSTGVHRTEKDS